jgi:hypothetical protein
MCHAANFSPCFENSERKESLSQSLKDLKALQGDLPKVLGYLLKSPSVAYRVSRTDMQQPNGDWLLTDDGEVKAKFFQHKAALRPGERIQLFHAMKNHYLDQLALAGGQGRPLLAEAKRLALSGSAACGKCAWHARVDVAAPSRGAGRRWVNHPSRQPEWERYARKDGARDIEFGFGFDLSPLVSRSDELET